VWLLLLGFLGAALASPLADFVAAFRLAARGRLTLAVISSTLASLAGGAGVGFVAYLRRDFMSQLPSATVDEWVLGGAACGAVFGLAVGLV
jgi:hypothetical protein